MAHLSSPFAEQLAALTVKHDNLIDAAQTCGCNGQVYIACPVRSPPLEAEAYVAWCCEGVQYEGSRTVTAFTRTCFSAASTVFGELES